MIFLSKLRNGQIGRITCFQGDESLTHRLMEIGLYKNDRVQLIGRLPFGGNLVILSKDGKYVLRKKEADLVKVEVLPDLSL